MNSQLEYLPWKHINQNHIHVTALFLIDSLEKASFYFRLCPRFIFQYTNANNFQLHIACQYENIGFNKLLRFAFYVQQL
jgi:hypothetical protein